MTKRLKIARECLRQCWQHMDAGGHSLGRSIESMWLELAMSLIRSDASFSSLADGDAKAFLEIAKEEARKKTQKEMRQHDASMGLVAQNENDRQLRYKLAHRRVGKCVDCPADRAPDSTRCESCKARERAYYHRTKETAS
jgi:hypothetical protein